MDAPGCRDPRWMSVTVPTPRSSCGRFFLLPLARRPARRSHLGCVRTRSGRDAPAFTLHAGSVCRTCRHTCTPGRPVLVHGHTRDGVCVNRLRACSSAAASGSSVEHQAPSKKPGSCGRPGFLGSCDPRRMKASVAWSFPRRGRAPLDTVMVQRTLRLMQCVVMMACSDAHARPALEGALGVGGVGCGVHGRSVVSRGRREFVNGWIVKSVHSKVKPPPDAFDPLECV